MTAGTSTYKGLAVPLNGEVNLYQDTAATDFVTLTGDTSISGDFLVCRAGTTEKAVINSDGKLTLSAEGADFGDDVVIAKGKGVRFSVPWTTAPTTGMVRGEIFLALSSTEPVLGMVTNAATTVFVAQYLAFTTTASV